MREYQAIRDIFVSILFSRVFVTSKFPILHPRGTFRDRKRPVPAPANVIPAERAKEDP